ncbi:MULTISPECIES: hypothetical protein [unclassified Pseudomonas]|uniref:hypothetical protein n=1 Tax=unclassified Pseudomonas TaxID=196821 RepID=UPI0012DE034E|nr:MULTISPECIES: hypothetical protein [unclassified Pseudomonas]
MSFSNIDDLWSDSRLRAYLGALNRRCGIVETLALPTMRDLPPVKIETLFVPPLLSKVAVNADSDSEDWPSGKSLLDAFEESSRLVVLGDPGGGKTTLSNWIAWRLTSGLTSPLPKCLTGILPIPCVLRDMHSDLFKGNKSVDDLAAAVAKRALGDSRAEEVLPLINDWVNSGRFILILDGIDEIPVSSRGAVASWIKEARDKKACVLATSRIVGYEDFPIDSPVLKGDRIDKSAKRLGVHGGDVSISEDEGKTSASWADIRYLMPFNKNQISDFVKNWYRQRCVSESEAREKTLDLLGALEDSEVTSELARTPNLLSLMAVVHRERAHLPDGKALLYEEIVNAYLNTIDSQRKIVQDDVLGGYTWKDKKGWVAYVGFMMQSARTNYSQEGILVSERQVVTWLVQAMKQSRVNDPEAVALEFLGWVARRSGLLLPRGEGRYSFVHLSFQEYFCACYLEAAVVSPDFFSDGRSAKLKIKPEDIRSFSARYSWLETLVFVFEILSNERSTSWVERLIEVLCPSYPKIVASEYSLGELAARLLTNKHVKFDRQWLDYLADISSVMVYRAWDTEESHGLLASFISLGYAAVINDAEEDEFDDRRPMPKSFYKTHVVEKGKVRILIYRSATPLGRDQLAEYDRLSVLDCEDCTSVDLTYLNSKYLTVLSIQDGALKGAERINEFKRLSTLQLARVEQTGLEMVRGTSNLDEVLLCDIDLTSIAFLSGWKNLYNLDITRVAISDASVLKKLKRLAYLTLEQTNISDVSFLQSLTSLEMLSLNGNPIEYIPKINANIPINISYRNLKIKDLESLSDVRLLNGCVITECPISTLSGLESATASYLYLDGVPLQSLDGLDKMPNLTTLVIRDMDMSDLSKVGELKRLRLIRLLNVPVSDLKWVKSLKYLSSITLSGTLVTQLGPLANLKRLSYVLISESDDLDVSAIKSNEKISLHIKPLNEIH